MRRFSPPAFFCRKATEKCREVKINLAQTRSLLTFLESLKCACFFVGILLVREVFPSRMFGLDFSQRSGPHHS